MDIIDLGCGSGVIGITLDKKISTNSVDLIDISEKAIEVANKNCELLNSKAKTVQSNFFENVNKKYDVVISNPPYIQTQDIEKLLYFLFGTFLALFLHIKKINVPKI